MIGGLGTAAAGMAAQQARIAATANDLANASTTGYKPVRVGVRDLEYSSPGRAGQPGVSIGTGAVTADLGRTWSQGAMRETGRTLDVALTGEGFIKVKLPDGRTGLTRDGGLGIDGRGRLTSGAGLVQPPMTVPAGTSEDAVAIGTDGTVTAGGRRLGRIDVVSVRSPQGLEAVGGNAYVATAASGAPTRAPAATTLQQGTLEGSGTDVGDAMVELIDAQRAYELASKAIKTADEMAQIANGVRR